MSTETKIEQARERAIERIIRHRRFDSPIEELFFWSLLSVGWPEVEYYVDPVAAARDYESELLDLHPASAFAKADIHLGYPDPKTMGVTGTMLGYWFGQLPVGNYRLDFAFVGKSPADLIQEMRGEKVVRIAVELDGHDFHERTKEQAQRDKERDRWLLEQGWATVRYTGSEIYRDADACVANLIDLIKSMTPRATMAEMQAFASTRRVPPEGDR